MDREPRRTSVAGVAQPRRSTPRPLPAGETIDEVWRNYEATHSRDARDRLILHYAPVVKFVAGRARSRMPYHVEAADLVSCGIFGLIDAIEKFDPSRGIRFETYATPRIRGAIMDELRAIDWVPRSVRAKASEVQHAYSKLQGELRRCPDRAEVALELGVSEDALNRARVQISLTGLVALDELLASPDDDRSTHRGGGVADCSNGPDDVYEVDEAKRLLASAVNRLPNRERLVLTLYYYEGLTQAGIGDALGVSESRICQILAKALRQLRYGIGACGLAADSALLDRFECSA